MFLGINISGVLCFKNCFANLYETSEGICFSCETLGTTAWAEVPGAAVIINFESKQFAKYTLKLKQPQNKLVRGERN